MNALDYKVINHRWGGRVLVLFLFCPRLRTKVEQSGPREQNVNKRRPRTKREQNCAIGTNREHPGSVTNLSLLLIHHCYNNVTVLHLGNSVTIMQQWCVTIVSLLQDCYKYFKSVRVCAN